jgi:hypothetical protein
MRQATDPTLRQALHGMYVALFNAKRACPTDFHGGRFTTIQTAIMGIEDYGWRVVGIKREVLNLLATEDFNKNKLPRQLCRGQITDRIETTRLLFEREEPMGLEEFFNVFLHNDRTVIMLNKQNDYIKPFPDYIEIDKPDAALFPNGSLMSWKHRKKEREYLRQLHASLLVSRQE